MDITNTGNVPVSLEVSSFTPAEEKEDAGTEPQEADEEEAGSGGLASRAARSSVYGS